MANTFFDPGDQRAAKVQDLFARIAPRYDLINDLQSFGLHRYWKRRVVRLARPQAGQRALDVCCGTGDLALAIARRGAHVAALDFSERMLDAAQRRQSQLQGQVPGGPDHASRIPHPASPPPRFVQGDALRLPFSDNSFDIVTVGYGLRNLANWETGLHEMLRVANPGGRVLALEFGKPDNALWRGLYFGYLKLFVPCLGRIFCGNTGAYAYILESLKHYPAQHAVAAKMREFGLVNVRTVGLLGGAMSINYGEKRSGGVMEYWSIENRLVSITPPLHPSITPFPLPSPPSLPRRKHFGQNAPVNFRDKMLAWETLPEWRAAMRASSRRLVVTNGCFDLLHLGHVTYLETARQQGDALLVGVNGDEAVRQLKGPDRPVNTEHDRAAVLAALESVSGVCIFAEATATRFLAAARPDVYVKGGDYTLDTLNQEERRTVEQAGGKIVIIPFVPGKSTTALLKKISRL